jgi:hypothetical protein
MASLSQESFQVLVDRYNGDEDLARKEAALNGYTVVGVEGSGLAVAPGDAAAALQQGLSSGRQSIADMYKQITENIEKRYRAPSFNDMLIAIGTGMMSSPGENDSGGFGGAVQRGLRGIGTYAQNRNERRDALNDLMTKVDIQKVQDLAGLEGKYLPLLKPGAGSQYGYSTDRGGYVPKPGVGNNAPMPEMDQFGNYVITDQRQIVYLPPNTPIVLPGGDPTAPRYTRSGTAR